MKAATVNELKQELTGLPAAKLTELCVRLARFKKENKELLTYLLFEADDEQAYINLVKKEITELFAGVNTTSLYFAKKTIRKILRLTAKYIRYTGSKLVEVELLLHFCTTLKNTDLPFHQHPLLNNLYKSQLKKTEILIAALHEDLQYDYLKTYKQLVISTR
jgi:hypothetical protein